MTSTSPGRASATAAWIIRLSPGRTSTVKAGPASCMRSCTGATRPCMVPRGAAAAQLPAPAPRRQAAMPGAPPHRHVGKNGGLEGCGLFDEVGADALGVTNECGEVVPCLSSPLKKKSKKDKKKK